MVKLLKYLKGATGYAVLAPLMMILEVSMDLMQPKLMADIIDIGIMNQNAAYVFSTGVKMILAALLGLIGGAGCSVFTTIAAMHMGEKLRQALFDKIQTLAFLEIDQFKTSSLITRLTNDVSQVQNMVNLVLRSAFRAPLLCLGGMIMVVSLSPKLSIVFLVAVPVILIAVVIILKKSFPLFSAVQERIDRMNTVMREGILGIQVIKAFTVETRQAARFDEANEHLMQEGSKAQNMNMILWPVVMLVMNISIIAVLWFGGNMVNQSTLPIGKIVAFVNYLVQIMNALIMVVMLVLNFSRAKASADRINDVLDAAPSIQDQDCSLEMNGFDIEFKNVSFQYNEHSETVLNDLSFRIEEGEKIGIIGATGSGKSSLVNLVPRLYDATAGQVLIGGLDVKKIKLKELRENIGVILQGSILFSGTIEENLTFGSYPAGRKAVEEAARDAQAHDFILEKENAYQSLVEQRGKNFSGGQKQRISIARTLLRKPKILIMDDATSALDLATEAKLQTTLQQRMAKSTVLMIAQRISGVMDLDKIIVLENGKIAAMGTHQELLATSEIYRSIAVSQLGEEMLANG
ncbi:ABC transporter ATP-binding protein|uniref:ATP-binding cassette, subfamily B n=1 Tax=Dendrosporobacter quercicolus TaxID=146817 RepID=A0A1G9NK56_9FIRM|nr:ABC transporter ATP-binding protein [Dendrosporobacter quercicolus]NSL47363.1 ABC transporter ATP-binding protein [Dendrosporobacter quercicolus DSM 1736]SDL86741.1 ATP-binding cassette, subfamily B [Dendrosporobacter quercicolus]